MSNKQDLPYRKDGTRTVKSLPTLYIGDNVVVTSRHKLFANNVGEIYNVDGESIHVEFINSGVYLGSGMYQRYEVRRCASLIPLTG